MKIWSEIYQVFFDQKFDAKNTRVLGKFIWAKCQVLGDVYNKISQSRDPILTLLL